MRAWKRRNRALFVALPEGNVFAVKGDWWVGEIDGRRMRARWRRRRRSVSPPRSGSA